MNLELEREDGHDAEIVRVRGELDLTNTSVLADALDQLDDADVVLDLTALTFVDSAGLHTIDAAHRRLTARGRRLIVVAPPSSRAGWTFRVAAFGDGFVAASVEAALDSLARRV